MRLAAVLVACAGVAAANFVGGYLDLTRVTNGQPVGLSELQALAASASKLPITRLFLAFASPTMVYTPGSATLCTTGINASTSSDCGYAAIKSAVTQLRAGGVEVMLSMGGWNYNCFPYLYARYSVGGYGTSTPNYWKIQQYGGGDINNCVASNQYCYVCEPPSEGTTLASFSMFPEPDYSATWSQAVKYVTATAGGGAPVWNYEMVPGRPWTDTKTGITVTAPGTDAFYTAKRDPYADLVYLAADLGVSGIDIDYEEMWHADYYKLGSGPYTLYQTVYKYAAIAKDVQLNIAAIAPSLKLGTAAAAVGAWSGNWWGGNLKGVWLYAQKWYPDLVAFMATGANAGGINVMTYDLSDNEQYYECPETNVCTLDQQVAYYMATYTTAKIAASVGYEIGTPAYPDPTHDPTHQLPLTTSELQIITTNTQPSYPGGFFWELYKSPSGYATVDQTAQAICNKLFPGNSRCTGSIPPV
eukprot:TRINITY_DN1021_c0_g1_i1.p2 TRINITY_DN1021_c0_g1~~TRINITY_DN1021_c0_g1_i1.p2  ORF type:complete len:472 (+),score=193.10 TRINITY_DN1021_c0_g1_i1:102-1517(+)